MLVYKKVYKYIEPEHSKIHDSEIYKKKKKKNLCYNFPRYDFYACICLGFGLCTCTCVCGCVAWSKSASECVENVVPSLCDASCDVCACTGGVNRDMRPFSLL